MPPKKKGQDQSSKKTVNKQKEKIIEDKTFGLKNKKGKKQQQYVKNVTQQVKFGGNPSARKLAQENDSKKNQLEKKKKETEELNQLFKPVATKLSKDADPKSVVCAYFKQGLCGKGDKCKYSHDLTLERKGEKRSLYVDSRDEELKQDTMDTWDQQKLEEVVKKKHGEKEKKNTTDIVCKYFLEAIDKALYGWFWTCPNGNKCIYRHALPPGFVLKKKEQKNKEKDEISLEELIEEERGKLGTNLTKITLETFTTWKKRKLKEKKDNYENETKKKKEAFKTGRIVGKISGREVFQFRPELVTDDADDEEESFDITQYRHEEDDDLCDDETKIVELSLDSFNTLEYNENGLPTANKDSTKEIVVDNGGLAMACAVDDTGQAIGPTVDGVPVDQSLFEDLDDLDLEDEDLVD
ncbi:zinc finger CCCH domain-containing protein 15-like [Xenia sp. Carnegie-2017]|uniref:zinc finger CCCH domain-containing protein 15-like n=1 Tax=Xenia sp. Carnegie-2017 TaxID=2897299 RepID=UPI001F049A6A|nr:zinc finger CCCH domain-containing protein 15-like [Xenia sp. Carnegie-2017]